MLGVYLTFIFLGIFSSATSEEGFPNNNYEYDDLSLKTTIQKEKCSEFFDSVLCLYYNIFPPKLISSDSVNAITTQQSSEITQNNETPETRENSQDSNLRTIPFTNFNNNLQKRFSVFRKKNSIARGYKRGPGFRSWGGKRDSKTNENFDKKSKFVSWGGKRDEESFEDDLTFEDVPEKRLKFQSWGGKKRANDLLSKIENSLPYDQMGKREPIWKHRAIYLSEPFKKHVPKRPQFQSWGGKRALYPWYINFVYPHRYIINGEKRKFSNWGGKRYEDFSRENSDESFKRHVFQNWGGKRMAADSGRNEEINNESREKPVMNL